MSNFLVTLFLHLLLERPAEIILNIQENTQSAILATGTKTCVGKQAGIVASSFLSFVWFCKLFIYGSKSKWFEPRSISSLSSVIVRVSVVLKRTLGDSD